MKKPCEKEIKKLEEFIKGIQGSRIHDTQGYWIDAEILLSNRVALGSYSYVVCIKACNEFMGIRFLQYNEFKTSPHIHFFNTWKSDKGFIKIICGALNLSCMTKDGYLSLYITKNGNFKISLDSTSTCRKYMV